jgi:integrase
MARPTPGIRVRHGRSCASRAGRGCNCEPAYEAWVWSNRDQRKIYRSFPTLAAAKGWRADATSAVRKGVLHAPTRQTLREAADLLIEGMRSGTVRLRSGKTYKPSVIRGYRADLDRYVLPQLGAIRLAEIRRRDLQRLVDELVAAGYSGSKVRNVVTPVRVICRLAIENDELTVNPTANLRLPEQGAPRDRVASPAEAQQLLEALHDDDRALWATAFFGGLRRGELRGLRCGDVDLAAGVIRVSRGWDDVEGEIDPKSKAGARDVPIPDVLARYLRAHMLRSGRRGDDLLFGRTPDQPFVPRIVTARAVDAWAAAAVGAFLQRRRLPVELEPITLHECRHTYVSLMHAAGCSLEEIGDYVGHSSSYMTGRYRHLLPGQGKTAAARLDAFLDAAGAQTGAQRL